VIARSTAESEEKLDLSFFVAAAPVEVAFRVDGVVRSEGSAVNHVPESSVVEDQGNHLAPVSVVIPIVVEERDLVLSVLKLRLSRRDGGGVRHLGSGCGDLGDCCGSVLRCGARCLCAGAGGRVRLAVLASTVSAGSVSGHGHKDASRGQRHKRESKRARERERGKRSVMVLL
jgi:hypothetical protein